MTRQKILVIDDETDVLELVEYNLSKGGFAVTRALSGEEGLDAAKRASFDLVILDLVLPGTNGFGVCRALRSDPKTRDVPIIMLTAKGDDEDIIAGLEYGADDYVTKPFSVRILVSRVQAVLRRQSLSRAGETEPLQRENLCVDPGHQQVSINGNPVPLTITEFKMVHLLARSPGRVYTRAQIMDQIHGNAIDSSTRAVDVHIASIRQRLGPAARLLETVRGVGYRFKEQG